MIKNTSRLLFNEEPITINRLGARVLGLNEAIVVQQIHYWLEINRKAKINFHDGRTWTYNSYEQWQSENFDFWSLATLKRIFKKLFDEKILLKGNYNIHRYDRTLWVSIDYDKLDEKLNAYEQINVEISTECQNDTMENINLIPCKVSDCDNGECQNDTMENINLIPTIPKTTTETNTEISSTTQSVDKPLVAETNKELIENNTHLILDSKNKQNKASKWNKDRLLKAIDIFKEQQGEYFSLLEKIYNDDKNFVSKSNNSSSVPKVKTRFHNISQRYANYEPDELEKLLKESQQDKFTNNETNIDMNAIRERAIDLLQEKINADDTRLFKPVVRLDLNHFENEINQICNELLNK